MQRDLERGRAGERELNTLSHFTLKEVSQSFRNLVIEFVFDLVA